MLRFFQLYEAVIYFLIAVGVIVYAWRFWLAWEEGRQAVYGLERTSAQRRLNQNALMIFILLMMGVAVFSLVTFIGPTLAPEIVLPLFPTAAPLLDEDGNLIEGADGALATATPLPTVDASPAGCVEGSLIITSPTAGETVSGETAIEGSVQVTNLGFYKVEYARAQEELWLTIQAGRSPVDEGALVPVWDTRNIPPGEYVLQLIVIDNSGQSLPPCRVPIRISAGP
ncbi:MAG: hypothetical protein HYZ26_12685 [Chloroflexi bacterium]|nr:hypothetical protein [Chloroflexota bacterium]